MLFYILYSFGLEKFQKYTEMAQMTVLTEKHLNGEEVLFHSTPKTHHTQKLISFIDRGEVECRHIIHSLLKEKMRRENNILLRAFVVNVMSEHLDMRSIVKHEERWQWQSNGWVWWKMSTTVISLSYQMINKSTSGELIGWSW